MKRNNITEAVSEVYEALQREIQEIHVRWKLYRQLFAQNQTRFDLMSEIAATFFSRLYYILLDDVLLGIGRMTDPPKTGRNKNLSIYYLNEVLIQDGFNELSKGLEEKIARLNTKIKPFRNYRDKKLAHADLAIRLKTGHKPLTGISREQIEFVLGGLRAVLNDVQIYFEDVSTGYEHVVTQKDANTLIDALKYSYIFRQLMYEDPVKWYPYFDKSKYKDA
ncbi:MAG: AbiU2 domain-containing protein [Planctomycetota bacterium]|jgi:hypothetical protein